MKQETKETSIFVRFLVYVTGFLIMTLGIAISVKSDLGVSPVSSIPYTMTCVWGIEMGKATILFHVGLVLLQIILLRRAFQLKNLLQIPVGILFGYLTTFSNYLMTFLPDPEHLYIQLLMMVVSAAILVGVSLKVITRFFGPARDRVFRIHTKAAPASSAKAPALPQLMKKDVYTVNGDASLTAVLDLLTEKGISGVPVVDGDQSLIGFISDGDILRFLAAEHPLYVNPSSLMTMDFDEKLQELMHCKVRDVARKSVITVTLSDDLGTVCHVLSDHHIKKAPVLDDGDMVGVINASNITKYAFRRLEGIR